MVGQNHQVPNWVLQASALVEIHETVSILDAEKNFALYTANPGLPRASLFPSLHL